MERPYVIQPMTRDDLEIAVSWADLEGWNPGLHDADCFYAADPTGFWKGVLADQVIATISAVKYGNSFGFMGLYIVKPEYRGQGYGLQVWNAALETLKGRNVGLDGVLAQQENYKKSGFQLAYYHIRYEGVGRGTGFQYPDIIELSKVPLEAIVAYDQRCFPCDRTSFLRCWIHQPNHIALGVLQHNKLAGYGVMRPARNGYKIGPLFADDASGAEALLIALQATATAGVPIYLDVPEINPAAVALAVKHGMKPVFETARMYNQTRPELAYAQLFGVTTLELG
ncbi:MAG TPA: GNAT family N-acetyltransferase [Coleofasciculaceae cyanobacterium]